MALAPALVPAVVVDIIVVKIIRETPKRYNIDEVERERERERERESEATERLLLFWRGYRPR